MGDVDSLLVWVDRSGRVEPVSERLGVFAAARLSPDGLRIAVEVVDDGRAGNVWILGIEDDSFAPLNNEGVSSGPLWTPDGSRVLYYWAAQDPDAPGGTGFGGIYSRAADFSTDREEVLQTDGGTFPLSWSGDDLVLHEMIDGQQGQRRILVVPTEGEDRTPFSPLDPSGQFNQRSPMVSPDGRWVAYMSVQSGQDEIYVRPFPEGGRRVQISNNGGVEPMWGADASELFYRERLGATTKMIAVELETEPELDVVGRTELFSGDYWFMNNFARTVYDYDRANDRFLMVDINPASGDEDEDENSRKINVILNWFEELKQRVPTGR